MIRQAPHGPDIRIRVLLHFMACRDPAARPRTTERGASCRRMGAEWRVSVTTGSGTLREMRGSSLR